MFTPLSRAKAQSRKSEARMSFGAAEAAEVAEVPQIPLPLDSPYRSFMSDGHGWEGPNGRGCYRDTSLMRNILSHESQSRNSEARISFGAAEAAEVAEVRERAASE